MSENELKEDDLFTEDYESEQKSKPKPKSKSIKPNNKDYSFNSLAKVMREYYTALIDAGFSKKDALELTKGLLSASITGACQILGGIKL